MNEIFRFHHEDGEHTHPHEHGHSHSHEAVTRTTVPPALL